MYYNFSSFETRDIIVVTIVSISVMYSNLNIRKQLHLYIFNFKYMPFEKYFSSTSPFEYSSQYIAVKIPFPSLFLPWLTTCFIYFDIMLETFLHGLAGC